jgi:hypothetical protein
MNSPSSVTSGTRHKPPERNPRPLPVTLDSLTIVAVRVEFRRALYETPEVAYSGLRVEEIRAVGDCLPSSWRDLRCSLGLAVCRILILFPLL